MPSTTECHPQLLPHPEQRQGEAPSRGRRYAAAPQDKLACRKTHVAESAELSVRRFALLPYDLCVQHSSSGAAPPVTGSATGKGTRAIRPTAASWTPGSARQWAGLWPRG